MSKKELDTDTPWIHLTHGIRIHPYLLGQVAKAMEVSTTEIQEIKTRCTYDFRYFVHTFLPHHFPLPFSIFHKELIKDLSTSPVSNLRMVRIAPRGHGKTTLVSFSYVLWCLATERRNSIVLITSSQDHASERVQEIIRELECNEWLLKCYPALQPKKDKKHQYVKYTDMHVVFENNAVIRGKGLGSTIRGIRPRPDLIIIDDPEKDADIESPQTREKNKHYFDNTVRYLGKPGQAMDIIAIDTLKHFDSLIQYIYMKAEFHGKRYSAIRDDATQKVLWDCVYCYNVHELTDFEITHWKQRGTPGYESIRQPFYGHLHTESSHPENIVGLAEDNPQAFAQEFLAIPMHKEEMPLRRELWRYFDYSKEWMHTMEWRIGTLDLALGKTHGDYQAIAITGYRKGNYYLLDASLSRFNLVSEHPDEDSLTRLCALFMELYDLHAFVVEETGSQALFLTLLRRFLHKEGISCRIIGRSFVGNKHERIFGHLGILVQRGTYHIRRDWQTTYPDFMRQFEQFPKSDHDDAPDAANMGVMVLNRIFLKETLEAN